MTGALDRIAAACGLVQGERRGVGRLPPGSRRRGRPIPYLRGAQAEGREA